MTICVYCEGASGIISRVLACKKKNEVCSSCLLICWISPLFSYWTLRTVLKVRGGSLQNIKSIPFSRSLKRCYSSINWSSQRRFNNFGIFEAFVRVRIHLHKYIDLDRTPVNPSSQLSSSFPLPHRMESANKREPETGFRTQNVPAKGACKFPLPLFWNHPRSSCSASSSRELNDLYFSLQLNNPQYSWFSWPR